MEPKARTTKVLLPALLALALALPAAAADWKPADVADRSTIELLTVGPEEGEHWSTVWFVVIDGTAYVRLGPRAAERVAKNTTVPRMKIRVGDEVHAMRYEEAPEMAGRIADAMYGKYWTDWIGEPFRKLGLVAPPLLLRLVPDAG